MPEARFGYTVGEVMTGSFRHEAAFYGGPDGFLDATVPFIRDGIDAREPVLVAVDEDKIELLRETLGPNEGIVYADMREMGANPARIIPRWRQFVDRNAVLGGGMRGIGEPIWAGRDEDELGECHRHEALLNHAFEDAESFSLLCPYDTEALAKDVVAEARETHPFVWEDGESESSGDFDEARSSLPFEGDLATPVGDVATMTFDRGRLDAVRSFVWTRARAGGLGARDAGDLVLAASELAGNSVKFGGGGGELRMWLGGGVVRCEVADSGSIGDPLAGRTQPRVEQLGGRGLWLVNQVCDLVQIRSTADRTVVRVAMRVA